MTSINTNGSAMAALHTMRAMNKQLEALQGQIATGLRIQSAADNPAYWSVATTMRSDTMAMMAVADALNVSAAKIDVAYTGLSSVVDVLGEIKSRLVAAREPGVDAGKIQKELDALKSQVDTIVASSTFNGVSWLETDFDDMFDSMENTTSIVSSFGRGANGSVFLNTSAVPLVETALFNSTGGGILDADPRNVGTIGGLRYGEGLAFGGIEMMSTSSAGNAFGFTAGTHSFDFSGPLVFGAADQLSFDIIVDADNPAGPISAPYHPGKLTHVVIDRATVDAYSASANGVISTYTDFTGLLNFAMGNDAGARFANYTRFVPPNQTVTWEPVIDMIGLQHQENSGLDGSSMQVLNFTSTVGSGGFGDVAVRYGARRTDMSLAFAPFKVADGVVISFNFSVNRSMIGTYSFSKDDVNAILGVTEGEIATAGDMAALLDALIDRPEILISSSGSRVHIMTDPLVDRLSGSKTSIGFSGISVNIEPIPNLSLRDMDITGDPRRVDTYIAYIDMVSEKAIDGAAMLGALKMQVDRQTEFTAALTQTATRGIGRLVDADMNASSARLRALEAQQELALQSLNIANAEPQSILELFR